MSTETSLNSVQGTAIVTGASSGLGKVYADRLAKRGYDLILIARRGDRLDELARRLRKDQGVSVETLVADLGNPSDLKRVADSIAANNRIAMLVNNAGTSKYAHSSQVPLADVDQQLAVNSKALTHLSLAVLPGFRERNRGTIINITRCAGTWMSGSCSKLTRCRMHSRHRYADRGNLRQQLPVQQQYIRPKKEN